MKRFLLLGIFIFLFSSVFSQKNISIDFAIEKGLVKDLFGGNRGSDSTAAIPFMQEMGMKYVRTHDYHGGADYFYYSDFWNKDAQGNFTTINPDFDPGNPAHYHWEETDAKVRSIVDNDFSPYFRIGTSYPNDHFILEPMSPPSNVGGNSTDFSKFVQLVLHTIRHYNTGWDNGFEDNIQYWEVWNEPGGLFWNGSAIQFFEMYRQLSTAVKTEFPDIKLGALGAVPTTTLGINTIFREDFISYCHDQNLDLDFYSWHAYGLDNPYALKQISSEIRSILDTNNFTDTESHITEINAELDNQLASLITSAKGAAYYLSLMLTAQESDIDMLLLYPSIAPIKPNLFVPGFAWTKSAYGLKAFASLKNETPIIVESTGNEVIEDMNDASLNFMVFAAKDEAESKLYVLVSNYKSDNSNYHIEFSNLPWADTYGTNITQNKITDTDIFTESILTLPLNTTSFDVNNMASPSVLLLRLEADMATALPTLSAKEEISIFPNPTTGKITIKGQDIEKIDLFNTAGQNIKSIVRKDELIKLNLAFPKGLYLVKVTTKNGFFTKKIILE